MKRSIRCLIACSTMAVCFHSLAATETKPAEAAPAATPQQDTQYGRYYHKEWTPMVLDRSQVAVKAKDDATMANALKAVGINPAAGAPHTYPGWYTVQVPQGLTPQDLVAQLAAQPTLDFATPVFVGPYGPNFPMQEVMVGFDPALQPAQRDAILAANKVLDNANGKIMDRDWGNQPGFDRITSASKNGFEVMDQANSLARLATTTFAETDMMTTNVHDFIPNDTFFGSEWGIHNTGQSGGTADMDMNGPEAWDITTGSSSIVVVVMDIGVELTHPDINIAAVNADFAGGGTGGNPGNSCDNHGTACAGSVAARINNSLGVSGIAPNCRVASARIGVSVVPCNGTWNGPLSNSVNAINWTATNGYRVTSNSNSYGSTSGAVDTAYTNTHNTNNIIHFASAGNSGAGSIAYPASSPSVNAVAAIDRTGNRASFSQFGAGTKFAAPGVDIDTTDRTGAAGYNGTDYVTIDGTSFSCPFTAGVAALVLSRNPALTSGDVEAVMYFNAKDRGPAGYDTGYGFGIPDAWRSVRGALGRPANDDCGSAATVVAGGVYTGSLLNATFTEADGQSNCGNPLNGPDVWYSFTAPAAGSLRVTTCGTSDTGGVDVGVDTVATLFSTCGGSILDCNDDWSSATVAGCTGLDTGLIRDSAVGTSMTPGQNVRIRIQRYGGAAAGNFTLNVFFTPANDACANAVDVSSAASFPSGQQFLGTLVGASNDGTASCGSSATNADVWYTFTAPATCGQGILRVTTCGTHDAPGLDLGMDTVLSLHNTCGAADITCNDDWSSTTVTGCTGTDSGIFRDSAVSAVMNPGQTIKIRASKFGGATPGPFFLNVFYTPANDSCSNALAVADGTTDFCTIGATTDGPNEPLGCNFFSDTNVQNDVWFRYTASCTGTATFNLCSSGFDTKIAAYNNICPSVSNTLITCNDDSCGTRSVISFPTVAGTPYLIRVGGYNGATGQVSMNISCSGAAGCGSSDFDGDGDFGTDSDIEAFFACLGGNCCPTCFPGGSDFDGDGDSGTDCDITNFFRVLGGSACGPC